MSDTEDDRDADAYRRWKQGIPLLYDWFVSHHLPLAVTDLPVCICHRCRAATQRLLPFYLPICHSNAVFPVEHCYLSTARPRDLASGCRAQVGAGELPPASTLPGLVRKISSTFSDVSCAAELAAKAA